jgi:hypothetical protein
MLALALDCDSEPTFEVWDELFFCFFDVSFNALFSLYPAPYFRNENRRFDRALHLRTDPLSFYP